MRGKKVNVVKILCAMFALFVFAVSAYSTDMNFAPDKEDQVSKSQFPEDRLINKGRGELKKSRREIEGRIFYIQTNMWYEKPNNFATTNFHRGRIIPVGTEVRADRMSRNAIKFTILDEGIPYTYIRLGRHSKIGIIEVFNRYFAETNPMVEGGKFSKFTKEEQANIKEGTIAPGMSKAAVLMAYGYPPSHKTPALSSDVWLYWESRAVKVTVYFKDGKVVRVDM